MKNLNLLSSAEILGIKSPEKLFRVSTEIELKQAYRKFSALWHPDKHITDGQDTTSIFAHIQMLYEKALLRMKSGEWGRDSFLKVTSLDNSQFEIKFLVKNNFEFGECFISRSVVAWEFNKNDQVFAERAKKILDGLNFANDKMRGEIKKYIPELIKIINTSSSTILVLKKDSQSISLRDVLGYYKGFVDPKHVAWVLSGMYNLACFNQYNKLMQAGFSLDNYFITPSNHLGQLIGGWWFSHKQDEKLIALSSEAVNVAPLKMINKKIADTGLDLELIKLVGRQLLGDPSGIKLRKNTRVPRALADWLNDSSSDDAFVSYEKWQKKVLPESFGVRRFTKMDLTINDIYS